MGSDVYAYFIDEGRGGALRPTSTTWPRTPATTCTPTASRSPPGWTPARTSSAGEKAQLWYDTSKMQIFDADERRQPGARATRTETPRRARERLSRALNTAGRSPTLARAGPSDLDHVRAPDVLVEHRVALAGHPHVGVGRRLALLQQVALLDQAADRGELLLVPARGGLARGRAARPRRTSAGPPRPPPSRPATGTASGRCSRSARRAALPSGTRCISSRRSSWSDRSEWACTSSGSTRVCTSRTSASIDGAARATGTPTPGGARRARSTCRRSGRRRSAAGARPRRAASAMPLPAPPAAAAGRAELRVEVAHLVDRADDVVDRDHLDAQRHLADQPERVDDLLERRAPCGRRCPCPASGRPARPAPAGAGRAGSRSRRRLAGSRCHGARPAPAGAGAAAGVISISRYGITFRMVVTPTVRSGRGWPCGWMCPCRCQRGRSRSSSRVQRLDADVRAVLLVAEAARRGVGEQHVDRAGPAALRRRTRRTSRPARRRYSRWLYWFGPGR